MNTLNIVISFLLVTFLGNALIASWQHRTWVQQKRFEKKATSITSLLKIFDYLVQLMSKRRFAMLRVIYALKSADEDRIRMTTAIYDEVLNEWNIRFNELLIKITFHLGTDKMSVFENDINEHFVNLGRKIESLCKNRDKATKTALNEIEKSLNKLSRDIFTFNRDVYQKIHSLQKREVFSNDKMLNENEYHEATNWALFRNLFKSRI